MDKDCDPGAWIGRARKAAREICLALFERDDMRIQVKATHPLTSILGQVALLLERYGKSLAPTDP